jgi:glucose uptake protein
LYYLDFSIGALLLALVAAYTLGTMGDDVFTNRIILAGRTAQVWAVTGGAIFNLGNMLLVAAISLIGMSAAFPLAIGTALVITSFFHFRPANLLLLPVGILLMLIAVSLDGSACRLRNLRLAKPVDSKRGKVAKKPPKSSKGIVVGILSGVALGLFYPVLSKGMAGDVGLGPYAGALLFCLGLFVSTLVFCLYFLNAAIEGAPLTIKSYFQGKFAQHALGFFGGVICAVGLLSAALALSTPPELVPDSAVLFVVPLASVLLAFLWGISVWHEFKAAPASAKGSLAASAVCFACGLALLGIAIAR